MVEDGLPPISRKLKLTPVFLPEKFYGQKSLKGYGLWGRKELDMTEQLSMRVHTHTHLKNHLLRICMVLDCEELVYTPLKEIVNHCALNCIVLVFILGIL